jgi:hypothetical protein
MTAMAAMLDSADVQRGLARLAPNVPRVIEDGIAICEVPAPTFDEARRGEFVARRMEAMGLPAPRTDAEGDVICELPGDPERGTVVVMAHLDTVFGIETPVKVRREGGRLHAPGIGDNSMALSAMLWLGDALRDLPRRGALVLAANVGEEGLGNLRGARALWDRYGEGATAWVALEGAMSGEAVNLGIPSRRLQIAYGDRRTQLARLRSAERDPRPRLPDRPDRSDPATHRSPDHLQHRRHQRRAVGEHHRAGRRAGSRHALGGGSGPRRPRAAGARPHRRHRRRGRHARGDHRGR